MPKKKAPKGSEKMSNNVRMALFWIVIAVGIGLFWAFSSQESQLEDVAISDVIREANDGQIAKLEVRSSQDLMGLFCKFLKYIRKFSEV